MTNIGPAELLIVLGVGLCTGVIPLATLVLSILIFVKVKRIEDTLEQRN